MDHFKLIKSQNYDKQKEKPETKAIPQNVKALVVIIKLLKVGTAYVIVVLEKIITVNQIGIKDKLSQVIKPQ